MATVSAPRPARQRRSKAPAPPPVATPVPAPPPVAAKAPAPAPAGPAVRHGKMSLRLSIGGNTYRLAPAIAGPPIEGVVLLHKTSSNPAAATVAYAVATDGLDIHCTCPDHEKNGAVCKHIMAIRRAAAILAPFAVPAAAPAPAPAPAPARGPVTQGFARATAAATARINGKLAEGWQPGGRAPAPADDTS